MPVAAVQPVPPLWRELGKSVSDLLLKDYPVRGTSIEVKTSSKPVTFRVAGNRDIKSTAIAGDLEGKYVDSKNGIAFTQIWTTANKLATKIECENQIAKGLMLDLTTILNQPTAQRGAIFIATYKLSSLHAQVTADSLKRSAVVIATYKQPSFHTQATVNLFKGPTFTSNVVLGRDSALVGAEATYDASSCIISRYAGAIGYTTSDYAITIHALGNLRTFSASYYHKASKYVEVGAKAVYDTKSTTGDVALEFGSKFTLKHDPANKLKTANASVKLKINNAGLLSASYAQPFRPGVKATLGLTLDTQRLHSGSSRTAAHKIGAALILNS
ncbi:hypothetical protein QFC21_006309 [Naganishia friedmannii]|uniref:Uncharacterized protein n=1 Tax=Naganishia friedmannii TaxID=89922 RepID=A0ACC2V2Y6_9TREE|nr:hypothetical protein QFC21_006309 [Naganishia friedmannii]